MNRRVLLAGVFFIISVIGMFARDFYARPCEKTAPIVTTNNNPVRKLTNDYYAREGGINTFVIQLKTLETPIIIKGNFLTNVELEKLDACSIYNIDGIIYPINKAISTCHKPVLQALAKDVTKYIVDGKTVSEQELYKIPAYMYECATISGNTLSMKLRKNKDADNKTLGNLNYNECNKYKISHGIFIFPAGSKCIK